MRHKIVFVINSLHTGGAERVLERLLTYRGAGDTPDDICVVLLDDQARMRTLPPWVHIYTLDSRGSLLRSLLQLRRFLQEVQPALAVSLLVRANLCTALVMRFLPGRSILCERMHLRSHLAGRYTGLRRAFILWLPRRIYPLADYMLAVSEGVRTDLIANFGIDKDIVRTIYNPYDKDAIRAAGEEVPAVALPDNFIVAVGRLVAAKNFALLISAYARSGIATPLVILGEGEERAALLHQIATMGLTERIIMPGFVDNPFAIMAGARWLISASRNEGFPNVVAEAMALGCPVAVTDCPSGPAELLGAAAEQAGDVTHAPFGLIVRNGDEQGLIAALQSMEDDSIRAYYALMALRRIEDFGLAEIASQYWSVFDAYAASTSAGA